MMSSNAVPTSLRHAAYRTMWTFLFLLTSSIGTVQSQCGTLLDALQRENPQFAALVELIGLPPGVPAGDVFQVLKDPEATITALSPPQDDANGILYSFRRNDITRDSLYYIVGMHLLRENVPRSRLEANPNGQEHETFNEAQNVIVDVEGRVGGNQGNASTALLQTADLDACAPNAVLHSIRKILTPADLVLPESAAPRAASAADIAELEAAQQGGQATSSGGALILYVGLACAASILVVLVLLAAVYVRRQKMHNKQENDRKQLRGSAPAIMQHDQSVPHHGMMHPNDLQYLHSQPPPHLIPAHPPQHAPHACGLVDPNATALDGCLQGHGHGADGAQHGGPTPPHRGVLGQAGLLPIVSLSTRGGGPSGDPGRGGLRSSQESGLPVDGSAHGSATSQRNPSRLSSAHAACGDGGYRGSGEAQSPFGVMTVRPGEGMSSTGGGGPYVVDAGSVSSGQEHARSSSNRSHSQQQAPRLQHPSASASGTSQRTGTSKAGGSPMHSGSKRNSSVSSGGPAASTAARPAASQAHADSHKSAAPGGARLIRSLALHQRTRLAEDSQDISAEEPSAFTRVDSDAMARAHALKPPAKGASAGEHKMWLDHQLDSLVHKTLLRKFVVLGPDQRRYGGQAIVQFARSASDGCYKTYALKFFLKQKDFESEKAIYRNSPIGKLLPMLAGIVEHAELEDADGHQLPPCIIMERGESLNEWCKRRKPDIWGVMPILANVAKRLEDMHAAGYVHRDLKPANVMWLERENLWTLIDFGCAAKTGVRVSLSFTLSYAAPETVRALRQHAPHVVAHPAADAWALGVMMFELLTGHKAFDSSFHDHKSVMAMLDGVQPLPWESLQPADRKALGEFRKPVLQLLNRNPEQRPSMSAFYERCNAIFFTNTTTKIGDALKDVPMPMHTPAHADSNPNATTLSVATPDARTWHAATSEDPEVARPHTHEGAPAESAAPRCQQSRSNSDGSSAVSHICPPLAPAAATGGAAEAAGRTPAATRLHGLPQAVKPALAALPALQTPAAVRWEPVGDLVGGPVGGWAAEALPRVTDERRRHNNHVC